MKCLAIFVLFTISLCACEKIVCQHYDSSLKLLETFCDYYRTQLPADCSNVILDLNPDEVKTLKIEGCDISTVANAGIQYKNVEHLIVSYSGYTNFDWIGNGFRKLKVLDASNNALTVIPSGTLEQIPELKTLDLSHNNIKSDSIDSDAFTNLTNLREINLNNNGLSSIPLFHDNDNLEVVLVEENPYMTTFNCTFFTAKPFELYLSWNYITRFNGDQDCEGKQFSVNHTDSGFGIIPQPNGKYELRCNEQSFKVLHHFIAGRGTFENVTAILNFLSSSVMKLDLSGNSIGQLNATTFERFQNLRELLLSDTNLTAFDCSVLNVKNQQLLNHLDISNNELMSVENPVYLQYFGHLEDFNASGNRIGNIENVARYLTPSAQNVDLSGSPVGQLDAGTFGRLTALKSLNLSNTNLSIADYNAFEPLRRLTTLDISHNNLTNVNFALLQNTLYQLQHFLAADCSIQNASEVVQYLGPFIKTLDLSGNSIGRFKPNFFDELVHLNLSNTDLYSFDAAIFDNLTALTSLDLSQNKLEEIDFESVTPNLQHLNLEGNDLHKIEHFNETNVLGLKTLALSENELDCGYLEQLVVELKNVSIVGDPFQQKHGHCHSNTALIVGIVIAVIVVLLLLCCLCFICRKRLCRK